MLRVSVVPLHETVSLDCALSTAPATAPAIADRWSRVQVFGVPALCTMSVTALPVVTTPFTLPDCAQGAAVPPDVWNVPRKSPALWDEMVHVSRQVLLAGVPPTNPLVTTVPSQEPTMLG